MAFCNHCGTQVEGHHRFCAVCGNPIVQQRPIPVVPAVKPRSTLSVLISVLLCIFLLISMISIFSILIMQNTIRQDTILTFLQRVDLDEIPMWQLDADYEDDKSISLADFLCQELNATITDTINTPSWNTFTPEELDRFLQETTFPEFIARQIVRLLDAYLVGDTKFSIRSRDVEKLLQQNREYLYDELEIQLDEDDISLAARQFLQSSGFDDMSLPKPDRSTRNILEFLDTILTPSALLPGILVSMVLLVLLFIVNWRHPRYALRDAGIVCILGTASPLIFMPVLQLLVKRSAGNHAVLYIGSTAASCVMQNTMLPCVIIFAVGVFLLVLGTILKFRKQHV